MSKTAILLLEYVDGLGTEGELVEVAAGYARNYLLPKKLAILSNRSNAKYINALQKRKTDREKRELEEAQALQNKLASLHLAIPIRTGEGGKKLFGSINAHSLIKRLEEEGIALTAKQFHWGETIRALGKYSVPVKLCHNLIYELPFEVVSENPIEAEKPEKEDKDESYSKKKGYKKHSKSRF
jgi:large subunit ribosomal protein L9